MMMIILRSPFRRRQAPQTSAAPQPFQHWPPDKVHQSHGIDHHNQNIQKIIKLSKKDHQNLHLPAAEHHASSMPAKVLCNCQPAWSRVSFAFCQISYKMSVFLVIPTYPIPSVEAVTTATFAVISQNNDLIRMVMTVAMI